ncbi:hypothetical protein AFI02nite_30550 [Aliivibrio fischeri]|uniref:Uncharacterized protein n=1 Tax=Aliivibrio fischeri TaxID=668 RepID=A0A510UKF3_ALIFS|nr:hypothetical protein AFI02nite_30550 [Aliivibrio fischeri]
MLNVAHRISELKQKIEKKEVNIELSTNILIVGNLFDERKGTVIGALK